MFISGLTYPKYSAPNEECGEIPVAFVVRRQETTLSEQDVISYVAAQVRLPTNLPDIGNRTCFLHLEIEELM